MFFIIALVFTFIISTRLLALIVLLFTPEETDQVLGEFLFGGHENNTKKRTLLKMWNERQRLIRNNQENAETWKKSTQVGQWKEKYKWNSDKKERKY